MFYLVEFSSNHWAGAPEHVIVEASSEEEAEFIVSSYTEEYMYNLYSNEYEEEEEESFGDGYASIDKVELLDETHAEWQGSVEKTAEYYGGCDIL